MMDFHRFCFLADVFIIIVVSVVDVVRTDRHLEFYNEGKNSARMSDILAVYAWVDPDTGYCQGIVRTLGICLTLSRRTLFK